MAIVIAQFHGKQEVNQVTCQSAEEARTRIEEGNATAAKEWRWGLSDTTFLLDDGTHMDIDAANAIRRACGVNEY